MVSLEEDVKFSTNKGHFFEGKNTGGFRVICGKAVCPSAWGASVMSWVLIVIPSGFQLFAINSQF